MWTTIWEAILDTLYPGSADCLICANSLSAERYDGICRTCLADIEHWRKEYHICTRCGKFISLPGLCQDCRRHRVPFQAGGAVAAYRGAMKEALHLFKFGGKRWLSRPLGKLMAEVVKMNGDPFSQCEVVIPVPLHGRNLQSRGYNQAALLAGEVGKNLTIPVAGNVLVKVRDTPDMVGLGRSQRLTNLAGAFQTKNTRFIQGKRILLVDDIYTTGSTVSACSEALLSAGAETICVLVAATGVEGG